MAADPFMLVSSEATEEWLVTANREGHYVTGREDSFLMALRMARVLSCAGWLVTVEEWTDQRVGARVTFEPRSLRL